MTPSVPSSTAMPLIHGLGGTAYDVGVPQRALRNAGVATHASTLPGRGTRPEDLIHMPVEAWPGTLTQAYERFAAEHDTVCIAGMCMGVLLALALVHRVRHGIARPQSRLALFATPVRIDGWSIPWYRDLRYAMYRIPGMMACMCMEEDKPFSTKNPPSWRITKVKPARGDSFYYPWVPLACIRQVDRLRRWALAGAPDTQCQMLVTHSCEDELTSLRSAQTLQAILPHARSVVLENSYHMVCVGNDHDQVAAEVLDFFGFDPAAARRKGPVTTD